jgi:hypothetical protein
VHARKAYGEVDLWLQSSLSSALDGVSGQVYVSAALLQGKSSVGVWMGFTFGVDAMQDRQISCPCQDSNPRVSSHSVVEMVG